MIKYSVVDMGDETVRSEAHIEGDIKLLIVEFGQIAGHLYKFTTVLLSKCVDGAYKFETQANNSTAKSPMGAFDQMEIDNDIVEVMKALEDY